VLRVVASFLLADARQNDTTFELMNKEGAFCRLVDLISDPKQQDEEAEVHRSLMELLYEMSRIQKITTEDLLHVKDEFVRQLFDIIEHISGDVHDPYHYPVIRVVLVLNEQFMVSAHEPMSPGATTTHLTNKIIKVLSSHGSNYKSFGENIILLLNREDETSLQLLTLKLLYLLFTTPPTYEYFYTNDLRVLVDILIRNLLDLPEDASALRHTYLRVLYPLLAHTQLRHPPQYKREEIRKMLSVLARGQAVGPDASMSMSWGHFEEVDDTTRRLVDRCQRVEWLVDPEDDTLVQIESPVDERSEPGSPISPIKSKPPALPAPRKLTKRKTSGTSAQRMGTYLRPQMEGARKSSLSMMAVAAQKERPGVITPSRNPALKEGLRAAIFSKKEKPPPPVARRSAWSRRSHDKNVGESGDDGARETEDDAQVTKIQTEPSPGDRVERPIITTSPSDIIVSKTRASEQKKPPPAPKARRWRGKSKNEEEETVVRKVSDREPGKFSANLPSIITTSFPEAKKPDISPFSPVEKTLTMSPPPADDEPKATVQDALGQAQAEAISGIRETLEKASLGPETALEESSPLQQEVTPPRGVLAPPGHVQRGVPGPRFELERSPFLSEMEEVSETEEDEWNDAREKDGEP
jgi:Protein of unknown function (DUF2013)